MKQWVKYLHQCRDLERNLKTIKNYTWHLLPEFSEELPPSAAIPVFTGIAAFGSDSRWGSLTKKKPRYAAHSCGFFCSHPSHEQAQLGL